jgi:aminobenzoyl-glutamate utilization protein B
MKAPQMFTGPHLTRRGALGISAGLAAGAGVGLPPGLILAQAVGEEGTLPEPTSVGPAEAAVSTHADAILRIRREVWELAELSLVEVESFRVHLRELEAAGFQTVSVGTSGFPTAFVSEWTQGSDGPVVAYLPEYDALPGLGNAPEPTQTPAASGNTNGHGCGHDMLGAGCTGAALALKTMMQASGTPGTVRVFGCAAEEVEGAKVYFVRDGLFDDVDAALAWHPAPIAATGEISTAAMVAINVRFNGRTAHAGNTPWDGRSALKGAELLGIGLQFMREHVHPTARIHYIYENTGVAPNIVPDFAQVWLTIRGADGPAVSELVKWARDVAAGAALMTQTEAEFQVYYGMTELVPNLPMIDLAQAHMLARPPVWTEAEQDFARTCQREMGLPELGIATEVLPPLPPTRVGGSSDLGDVSKVTPLGVFGWPTVGLGTSLHTWAITACGGMSIGDRASLDTARILAGMGHDLMTNPELRQAAKADLARRLETAPYEPLLPQEMKEPRGVPEWLRKTGLDDFVVIANTL